MVKIPAVLRKLCPCAQSPMCPIAHVPHDSCVPSPLSPSRSNRYWQYSYTCSPCAPYSCTPYPLWASLSMVHMGYTPCTPYPLYTIAPLPMCPIPLVPLCPCGPHCPCAPYPLYPIAPCVHIAHRPHCPYGPYSLYPIAPLPNGDRGDGQWGSGVQGVWGTGGMGHGAYGQWGHRGYGAYGQ